MKRKILFLTSSLLFGTMAAFAQASVSTNGVKHVVIEESTGAWCQFCPDGQVVLSNILAANPNAIGVSIHGGGGADMMKFPDGDALTSTYYTAFPIGMVDRFAFGGSYDPAQSRNLWAGQTTTRLAIAPDFDVTMNHGYDSTTRVVTINMYAKTLKAVTGDYNFDVYVVEDSVTGTGSGWNQVNYYNTQSGHPYYGAGNPIVGFIHRHVVRAMLGGPEGTTGMPTNSGINQTYGHHYTYTIPAGYNWKKMHLVAFVKKHSAVKTDRAINNAVEARLTRGPAVVPTDIKNVQPALSNLMLAPNPATSYLTINAELNGKGETNMTIINALGQTVMSKSYANTNGKVNDRIQTDNLANGVYYMNFSSEAGFTSEKFIVNRQ